MKYLKLFETETNNELYQKMNDQDYRIAIKESLPFELSEIRKLQSLFIDYGISRIGNKLSIRLKDSLIEIIKMFDDYYFIVIKKIVEDMQHHVIAKHNYKCDQLDGLIKCLQGIIGKVSDKLVNELEHEFNESVNSEYYKEISVSDFTDYMFSKRTKSKLLIISSAERNKIKEVVREYNSKHKFRKKYILQQAGKSFDIVTDETPTDTGRVYQKQFASKILISKVNDDWFIVRVAGGYINPTRDRDYMDFFQIDNNDDVVEYYMYYKCDQIDGLIYLLNEKL